MPMEVAPARTRTGIKKSNMVPLVYRREESVNEPGSGA
jgi:hypothetical protein